eukprot:1852682-Pyramimonas_sp.AAC.1
MCAALRREPHLTKEPLSRIEPIAPRYNIIVRGAKAGSPILKKDPPSIVETIAIEKEPPSIVESTQTFQANLSDAKASSPC